MRTIQAIFLVLACYVTFLVITRHVINLAIILKTGEGSKTYNAMWWFEMVGAALWLTYIMVS